MREYISKFLEKIEKNFKEKKEEYEYLFREVLREYARENYFETVRPTLVELDNLYNWKNLESTNEKLQHIKLENKFLLTQREKGEVMLIRLGLLYNCLGKLTNLEPLGNHIKIDVK